MTYSPDRDAFEPGTEFRLTAQHLGAPVEDGSIVLNLANGEYFQLNESAQQILDHLREPRSINDLREHVLSLYDVDEARCQADLQQVLRELLNAGLIEVVRTP